MASAPWDDRNLETRLAACVTPDESPYSKKTAADMSEAEIRTHLCGADCRECECLKVCDYGKEALRRGLRIIVREIAETPGQRPKDHARDAVRKVQEKPEGYCTKAEIQERWDVSKSTVDKWFSLAKITPELHLTGPCVCLNLYREQDALNKLIEWMKGHDINVVCVRKFERIRKRVEAC